MAILKIESAGIDRCYKCKKSQFGGWIGHGKYRDFICTRCISAWLRKFAKMARKYP